MNSRLSHEAVNERLPWFVNGTLPEDERRDIAAHLEECAACREALEISRDISAAVCSDRAIPIPPRATADELLRRADTRHAGRRPVDWRTAAAAAAIVVAILAYSQLGPGEIKNQEFTTATDLPATSTMNYVFEVSFAASVSEAERDRVLGEIGGIARSVGNGERTYQLTLELAPQALADLEALADGMAMRDEIIAAEIVALQVPVR